MHVVCFDIDGTLVASAGFDGELYSESIRDVLGVDVDTDWARYENVTDSGILDEILRIHVPADQRSAIRRAVQATFCERTRDHLARNSDRVREVPGALALVDTLRELPHVCVCVATGGWADTAALKLRAIGIDPGGIAIATGSDALKRTEIMRLAESRATRGAAATRRTYFGDGVWDRRAAGELGYEFVAIGDSVEHHVAFPDLQDLDAILTHLGV